MCAQLLGAAADSTTLDSYAGVPSPAAEAAGIGPAADPHAVLLSGSGAFATKLPPIVCPTACRELVYTFQDCPGHGSSTSTASYEEAVITFLLQQQEQNYQLLQGSAGGLKALSKPAAQSTPGGIQLPLLLHTRWGAASAAAAAGEEGSDGIRLLLELVAGNEVYGLLNRSWDQFIRFSDAYNAAGRKLPVLAAAACKEGALPAAVDPTAHEQLSKQVVQLREQLKKGKEEAAADLDSVNKELAAYKKEVLVSSFQLQAFWKPYACLADAMTASVMRLPSFWRRGGRCNAA
ncbi:hypothetical protein OEZ86_006325 [Tetradesmus obliquus]|nr:hypothetical protein OEZ86_006325 [Tetradesmus obliquus]